MESYTEKAHFHKLSAQTEIGTNAIQSTRTLLSFQV